MSSIKPLPVKVYSQIAAGEVIERPSSIVRELVDNSLDAGSSQIHVFLDLDDDLEIKIEDNGCGIHGEELPLALTRHATSKISAFEDIFELQTQGFRGEALAAISAVSKCRIISSDNTNGSASQIDVKAGKMSEVKSSSRPRGTTITISDIFYNTPVRKKFLKSLQAEKADIKKELIKQVLSNDGVGFQLHIQNKRQTKKELDIPAHFSLKQRVGLLFGKELERELIEVNFQHNEQATLKGYISSTRHHAKTRREQFFFVKKRVIHNTSFNTALTNAYVNTLPPRIHAACFLHCDFTGGEVDYNSHPNKKEVKFQRPDEAYRLIHRGVQAALHRGVVAKQRAEVNIPPLETEAFSKDPFDFGQAKPQATKAVSFKSNTVGNAWKADEILLETPAHEKGDDFTFKGNVENAIESQPVQSKKIPNFRLLGQIASAYIIYAIGDDLYVADQHAIHERMNFDDLREKSKKSGHEVQILLVPLVLEFSPSEIDLLFSRKEELKNLGLEIESFGENKIKIEEIPVYIPAKKEKDFVQGILSQVMDNPMVSKEELLEKCISTTACRMSIMAGDALSPRQMIDLIETMYLKDYIHLCPHGRPYVKQISLNELENYFDRH